MKRKIAIYIILISLLGLMAVQFRLLVTGVDLEKQRFDERVNIGLQEVKIDLEQNKELSDSIGRWLSFGKKRAEIEAVISETKLDKALYDLIYQKLARKGITADFTYAITNNYGKEKLYFSEGFVEKSFQFDYYNVSLGNRVGDEAQEERILHLDIPNLFNYLLGELDYLIIPSIFFLLILLFCLWFLVRMLRKEERLNEIKNEFINNLTHELKTPVFSISLAAKILKEHLDSGNLTKGYLFLEMIGRENEKLKIHIDKVLELATLESPDYQMEMEQVNLNGLVKEVVSGFEIKVENRKGRLLTDFSREPLMVKLDITHIKNVIQNLLENSLKYSNDVLEISVTTIQKEKEVQLIISDKGGGIEREYQKKVFQKFFRVPRKDLHDVKGFGLGLNYVKKIIELHKWTIHLESEKGKGAKFFISIPIY